MGATMTDNLPHRLAVATDAGRLRADEVWLENGWRKVPAQCPDLARLLPGMTAKETISLLDAWLAGYRHRSAEHAAALDNRTNRQAFDKGAEARLVECAGWEG